MKVSVIIPTYNRAKLVQESIDSVLIQSFQDFEIIVIDDGSTDDTEQALKRYSSKIIYIKQGNKGLNAARNRAIDIARGEYIALLDSDDLWRGFKLVLEVSILDAHQNIGFVFGDFYIMKPGSIYVKNGLHTWFLDRPDWNAIFQSSAQWSLNNIPGSNEIGRQSVTIYTGDIYHTSLFGPRVLPSASLFRKSMTEGWLKFNEEDSFCGDWEFFTRLSRRHGAAFIDVEMALNRSHEDTVRLTRADHRLQINKRLAMINNLWKLDDSFVAQHKLEIEHELEVIWERLLKLHLLAGDSKAARDAAIELNKLDGGVIRLNALVYKILAYMPGSATLLPLLSASIKKLGGY